MLELVEEYGTRRRYTAGGVLTVDITTCEYDRSASSLMTLWVRNGYVPRFVERVLWAQTYLKTDEGEVTDVFNPQVKDRGIDFAWLLEATPENEGRLLDEIWRRYHEWELGRRP